MKHESEGYPSAAEVPDYRKIRVFYTGTFSGPFGSGIKNAPIPPYLIEKIAGKRWTLGKPLHCREHREARRSVAQQSGRRFAIYPSRS